MAAPCGRCGVRPSTGWSSRSRQIVDRCRRPERRRNLRAEPSLLASHAVGALALDGGLPRPRLPPARLAPLWRQSARQRPPVATKASFRRVRRVGRGGAGPASGPGPRTETLSLKYYRRSVTLTQESTPEGLADAHESSVSGGWSGRVVLRHLDEAARPVARGDGAGAQQGRRHVRLGRRAVRRCVGQHGSQRPDQHGRHPPQLRVLGRHRRRPPGRAHRLGRPRLRRHRADEDAAAPAGASPRAGCRSAVPEPVRFRRGASPRLRRGGRL